MLEVEPFNKMFVEDVRPHRRGYEAMNHDSSYPHSCPFFENLSPNTSVRTSSLHLTSPSLSHLGWLQVQDPGSSPSHCTQDDEDPHLEADTEEGVRLAQLGEGILLTSAF